MSGEVIIIGRDPDCDLVLGDKTVSRRHARAERLPDGTVLITDLGSKNGTALANTGGRTTLSKFQATRSDLVFFGEHKVEAAQIDAMLRAGGAASDHTWVLPAQGPSGMQAMFPVQGEAIKAAPSSIPAAAAQKAKRRLRRDPVTNEVIED